MKLIYNVILLMSFITPLSAIEKKDVIVSEQILSQDLDDFDCHGSSIIEISPGVMCAVWKGGEGQGKSNIDMKQNVGIWLSFYKNNCWSEPERIVEAQDTVCWTPILGKCPKGIALFYRIGSDPRHTVSMYKYSCDDGKSWSKAYILPAGIGGPTRSKPLIDYEGNMIFGSSSEVGAPNDEYKATACWIEIISKEKKWSKYGPIEITGKRFGCIEPALFWANEKTALKMLCRDRSCKIGLDGWIWAAESYDNGKTWSELHKTDLPNPDSGIEVLALANSNTLLIYNNSHKNRYPLTLSISKDGGNNWQTLFNLEELSGEFPSAALDSDGNVHITYAWAPQGKEQRKIKHVVLNTKLF